MSGIIRAIIVMSLSGGVLAALLFILKPLVKNRLPKSAQYYLWLVVIAAFLIPLSRLVTLPPASAGSPVTASPVSVVDRYVVTSSESSGRIASTTAAQGQPESNNHNVQAVREESRPAASAIDIFMAVYPSGAAIALLYFIISYSVFINLHHRRNKKANEEETSMLVILCGNRRVPRLYRNPLAITPMLIGVLHPVIILPDRNYTDEQLHFILRHELTHHKRKDVFIKWLSVLACVVHWFNPIIWLVRREIDRACELACDEAVIRNIDNTGKQIYGDTLLYVAADAKMPHAVLSTTMCEEKKALKERLGAIMKSKKHGRLAVILSAVLIVAAILTACALGAGRSDSSVEFAVLLGASREEVYDRIGNPKETINEVDIFDIGGKAVHITYNENNCVEQINYNGEVVVNTPTIFSILTLDDVRGLADKGDALQYSDLPNLHPSPLSSTMSGYNPTLYGVEGGYRLLVNFNDTTNPESGIRSIQLESIWQNGGSGIDIRYSDVDEFIRMNPSRPADTVPSTTFQPRKWIDRESNEYSLTTTHDLILDEFPGVMFSYTPERLIATNDNGEKELFGGADGFIFGGYIDSVFLADLNGDGKPEFCSYTNWGSGFGDLRVIVYDYQNDNRFVLSDRGTYDYFLQMEFGQLEIVQTSPMRMNDTLGIGRLAIINGELVVFGIDRAQPITDPQSTVPPTYEPWMSSWRPLSELPADYTTEQAIADGVYVSIHGSEIYNQQQVDRFYDDVAAGGGAAFMRVMQYTIEGDAIITDYQYDGNVFTVTHDSTRDRFSAPSDRLISTMTYKYLVQFDHSRLDGVPFPYFLSNEEKIYTVTADGQGAALIDGLWSIPPPSDNSEIVH